MIDLSEILAPDEILYITVFCGNEKKEVPLERSSHWSTVRNKVVLANPFCMACGVKKDLQVHHLHPFEYWPELELEESNLFVLCRQHHLILGHLGDWKSYNAELIRDLKRWEIRPYSRVPDTYFLDNLKKSGIL